MGIRNPLLFVWGRFQRKIESAQNQPRISPDCSFFEVNEGIETKERIVQPSTHPIGSFGNGDNRFSSRNRCLDCFTSQSSKVIFNRSTWNREKGASCASVYTSLILTSAPYYYKFQVFCNKKSIERFSWLFWKDSILQKRIKVSVKSGWIFLKNSNLLSLFQKNQPVANNLKFVVPTCLHIKALTLFVPNDGTFALLFCPIIFHQDGKCHTGKTNGRKQHGQKSKSNGNLWSPP